MANEEQPKPKWNPIKNFKDAFRDDVDDIELNQPVINKDLQEVFERGLVENVAEMVAPEAFFHQHEYVRVGDEYCRTMYMYSFPASADDNWIKPLLRFPEAIDVSLHILPLPVDYIVDRLRTKVNHDEASINKAQMDNMSPDFRKERRYNNNMQLIKALEEERTKPFQVAVIFTIRASSLQELDRITDVIERTAVSGSQIRKATMRHREGFQATMPLLSNPLMGKAVCKNLHTHALQLMFPFISSDIAHETGVLMGINLATQGNIIVNRFAQPMISNPGMLVFGTSGSGKSYTVKMEMLQWAMFGVPIVVIDPQNEYDRVCQGLGGQFISISLDSPQKINPLDFSHAVDPEQNALAQKIQFMLDMVGIMINSGREGAGGLDDSTRAVLEEALRMLYHNYGFTTKDRAGQMKAAPASMPRMRDLYALLQRLAVDRKDQHYQNSVQPLLAGMAQYVGEGSLSGLFDHYTTVDLNSNFIVFNTQLLNEQQTPLAMQLILEFLRTSLFTPKQKASGVKRLLYVDEAHKLMGSDETAKFLSFVAKTSRKFGVGFTCVTQEVENFLLNPDGTNNQYGIGILQNCDTTMLLRQHKNALGAIQRVFGLTDNEILQLSNSENGQGLIYVGEEKAWLTMQGMTSQIEHEMITTDHTEVGALTQRAQQIDVQQSLEQAAYDEEMQQLPPSGQYPGSG